MKLNFPKQIYEIVKDLKYSVDNIGRSEDQVIIFEDKYVLKISKSKEILYREKQMNDYLYNKIPYINFIQNYHQ